MRKLLVFIMLNCSSIFCFGFELYDSSLLQEGDIIFHESLSDQAKALKLVTKSRYTHVAILFRINNEWYVEEAVQPVKYTKLSNFISRGRNKHYVIKRIKNSSELITSDKINKMKSYGKTFLNKNYDLCFEWDDKRIYCTELVWKIYNQVLNIEVGKLEHLKDFDLSDPFVKKLMKDRYGNSIPFNELVISPKSMFDAANLETVVVHN
jgi:hypothetical protein